MERATKDESGRVFFQDEWLRDANFGAPLQKFETIEDEGEEASTDRSFWRSVFSLNTLKGFILFVPGALMLAFVGVVSTVIFTDIFIYGRAYENLPNSAFEQIALLTAVGLVASCMTWFGIGNLKDRRHFAIPASVFVTGMLVAVIGLFVESFFGTRGDFIEAFADYNIVIYLLPLILAVPVLIREWLGLKPDVR